MTVDNNDKNPNGLHDLLIANNCRPTYLGNNAKYDIETGDKIKEATEVYIEIVKERTINGFSK